MINPLTQLVLLASSSSRRQQLLALLLDEFEVRFTDIDEHLDGPIEQSLVELASRKALSVEHEGIVIAADTVLVLDQQVLGKPRDRSDAVAMLQLLSGQRPDVLTAVAIRASDHSLKSEVISTQLQLRQLATSEIERYVATGAADDKAGSLEVQARAANFVTSIVGCRANVYGLPLCATSRLLARSEVPVKSHDTTSCCARDDLEEYLSDKS